MANEEVSLVGLKGEGNKHGATLTITQHRSKRIRILYTRLVKPASYLLYMTAPAASRSQYTWPKGVSQTAKKQLSRYTR
jgi:hypothetical protein